MIAIRLLTLFAITSTLAQAVDEEKGLFTIQFYRGTTLHIPGSEWTDTTKYPDDYKPEEGLGDTDNPDYVGHLTFDVTDEPIGRLMRWAVPDHPPSLRCNFTVSGYPGAPDMGFSVGDASITLTDAQKSSMDANNQTIDLTNVNFVCNRSPWCLQPEPGVALDTPNLCWETD